MAGKKTVSKHYLYLKERFPEIEDYKERTLAGAAEKGYVETKTGFEHLALYARYGITTVNSLGGGQPLAAGVRAAESSPDLDRARLMFSGPVVTAT